MTGGNSISTDNLNSKEMYQGKRFESLKKTCSKSLLERMYTDKGSDILCTLTTFA